MIKYTNVFTCNKLIEGLIHSQLILADKYDLVQESENIWFVRHNENDQRTRSESPIPKYQRLRKVTKSSDGSLSCTCGWLDCFQIPCCHIILVNNGEIKISDVGVQNTIEYAQKYGDARYKDDTIEFDQQIAQYKGPKYHVLGSSDLTFPLYRCMKKENENMEYFNNGNTTFFNILNYEKN